MSRTQLIGVGLVVNKSNSLPFFSWLVFCKNLSGPPSIQSGFNLKLTKEYRASSTYTSTDFWNTKTAWKADNAVKKGTYWCSKQGAKLPVFWWISFKEQPVEIVSISFEAQYPGARFEFFASNTTKLTKAKSGRKLISGTQEEINHLDFENGQFYHHYGFKITTYGERDYVSLKNFDFFVQGKP